MSQNREGHDGAHLAGTGDDEFAGIRDYRDGDNPRRVFWKSLARGQELQSKEYAALVSDSQWLDWEDFPGLSVERRLSALCYWVLEHHRRERPYGLRIPGVQIEPGNGDRHRDQTLRALALFRLDAKDGEGAFATSLSPQSSSAHAVSEAEPAFSEVQR